MKVKNYFGIIYAVVPFCRGIMIIIPIVIERTIENLKETYVI